MRGITAKSGARRELMRRAFADCVNATLALTRCAGCRGWHIADGTLPGVELDERKAFRRLLRQWRVGYKIERRALRLTLPIGIRYRVDLFPEMYSRFRARGGAMIRLESEVAGPLKNYCAKDSLVLRKWAVRGSSMVERILVKDMAEGSSPSPGVT